MGKSHFSLALSEYALTKLLMLLSVCSYLYQIAHLGDDDEEPEFSSAMPLEEGDTFFFQPRPLKNLVLVDELDSLSPILCCQVCSLTKLNHNASYSFSSLDQSISTIMLLLS